MNPRDKQEAVWGNTYEELAQSRGEQMTDDERLAIAERAWMENRHDERAYLLAFARALESRVLAESSNKADEEWCKAYAEEWQDTLKEQSDRIKELERVLAERSFLTEREVIAISNALQGSNYAYLGDRLRSE